MTIFDQFLRDLAEGPRIAREITEKAARECGVCHHCGREIERGPCRMRECPVAKTQQQSPESSRT